MEHRANIKFCLKLGKTADEIVELMRQVYGIIVNLMQRYSGGMHDSKVVWKRLNMKPGLGVHFLFVTRYSLRK